MTIEEAIQLTRGCAELLEFDPMTGEPTPPHRLEYEQAQAIRVVLAEIENTMASKQERWIPVSERLPEKSGDVLVCTYSGYIASVNYSSKHKQFNNYDLLCFKNESVFDDVVAWMPMPEPFGGVENG